MRCEMPFVKDGVFDERRGGVRVALPLLQVG